MRTVKRLMRAADPMPDKGSDHDAGLLADILRQPPAAPAVRQRSRRWVAAVAAVIVIAAGLGIIGIRLFNGEESEQSADEPYYSTTARLEDAAAVIFRGTVTDTRDYAGDGAAETEATVVVSKVAKGDWTAGQPAEVIFTRSGSGPESPTGLRKGGEYVFLLTPRDSTRWNLVNNDQGYYVISAGSATPAAHNSVPLSDGVRRRLGLK